MAKYPSQHPDFNPDGSVSRQLQLRLLDILIEVDKICRKHNLRYCLSCGTLLGAVRHGGFIPWDDDIDIEMPLPDYKRLLEILPKELPENLVLQTSETDDGYFFTYAKVRDTNSKLMEVTTYDRIFKYQGIYIDIFPLIRRNQTLHWLSLRTHGRCYVAMKRKGVDDDTKRRQVRRILWWNEHLLFPIFNLLSKILPCRIGYVYGLPFQSTRKSEYLFPTKDIEFEGHTFRSPHDPDAYLTALYGDYMKLPDLSKLQPHVADVQFNVNR